MGRKPNVECAHAIFHAMQSTGHRDAVFLDENKRVLDVVENIGPWRLSVAPSSPAKYLIEAPAGDAKRLGLTVGEVYSFKETNFADLKRLVSKSKLTHRDALRIGKKVNRGIALRHRRS